MSGRIRFWPNLGGSAARSPREERLLARIRAFRAGARVEEWSDAGLRHMAGSLPELTSDEDLAQGFAVVDETVRRRLGAWRVFNLDLEREPEVVAGARRVLAEAGSGGAGDVQLPGEFYREVRRLAVERPELRFQPTDRQLLAGLHLWSGRVAELASGEGKTVAILYPALLHALSGRTVHVGTSNDYLAERDWGALEAVYSALGVTSGYVVAGMDAAARVSAYRCRVVYGTLREFGFDYLRDQLVTVFSDCVQGPLDVLVVDETDQVLLDEAVTPLVIGGDPVLGRGAIGRADRAVRELVIQQRRIAAGFRQALAGLDGGSDEGERALWLARAVAADPFDPEVRAMVAGRPGVWRRARRLLDADGSGRPSAAVSAGLYCLVDPEGRYCSLQPVGLSFLEERLGDLLVAGLDPSGVVGGRSGLLGQVYQLLRAHLLLRRDVDYVVDDGRVVLVDRETGRPRPDSRYRDGLQSAVEAREGLTVHPNRRNLAELGVPGLVRRYGRVCGVTGTAQSSADEFRRLYGLEVAVVASEAGFRRFWDSRVYPRVEDQLDAVVDEVRYCLSSGRPVLVSCRTVEKSLLISGRLDAEGVAHGLLNARTVAGEVSVVGAAGAPWAVTVATNMAGRGTDVVLLPGLDDRLLEGFVDVLRLRCTKGAGAAVVVRASTSAEAELLARRLSGDTDFALLERWEGEGRLLVGPPWASASWVPAAAELEFGLGLHLLSTEFNESPRVALQLEGRVGRQGAFGSGRSLLAASDPALSGLEYGELGWDDAGRACWQGPAVERRLERRREEARLDAARARDVAVEYGAVVDLQAHNYYRARRELLSGSSSMVEAWACDAVAGAAARVVSCHFPGLAVDAYAERFAALSHNVQATFGVYAGAAWGCSLDDLGSVLGDLVTGRLEDRRRSLGVARFSELARLLALAVGDELWEVHRELLRDMGTGSRIGGLELRTALAEYVIWADQRWQDFVEEWRGVFLSRLCLFPVDGLAGGGSADAPVAASDLLGLVK